MSVIQPDISCRWLYMVKQSNRQLYIYENDAKMIHVENLHDEKAKVVVESGRMPYDFQNGNRLFSATSGRSFRSVKSYTTTKTKCHLYHIGSTVSLSPYLRRLVVPSCSKKRPPPLPPTTITDVTDR